MARAASACGRSGAPSHAARERTSRSLSAVSISSTGLIGCATGHRDMSAASLRSGSHSPVATSPWPERCAASWPAIATATRSARISTVTFCGHGGVADWTAADWTNELEQFYTLLFHAAKLPFGRSEIVGDRTPCLEGNLSALYPVLKRLGFRYDASRLAPLGQWPRRRLGIWSFPLLEIPFVGHTFRVVSMDYNFFANQVSLSPARAELETYSSLWNAFRVSYPRQPRATLDRPALRTPGSRGPTTKRSRVSYSPRAGSPKCGASASANSPTFSTLCRLCACGATERGASRAFPVARGLLNHS